MQVRLIVPNEYTSNGGQHTLDVVECYGQDIARIAGGFTSTQGTGGWIDPQGNLVVEPVTVFDMDVPQVSGLDGAAAGEWFTLAKRICADLHQQCVYLRIEGEVHYVTNN